MSYKEIQHSIQQLGRQILPAGAKLLLYGSRARGDWHQHSDWDLLVLLPKDQLTPADYDNISYPFTELGWKLNQSINPILYTTKEWEQYRFTPFHHNVEHDAIRLCN